MAEGHTIHNLARRLAPVQGSYVRALSPAGTAVDLASLFDGSIAGPAVAHGKHLFWSFETAPTLHLHLGMFGRVQVRLHRRKPSDGQPPTDLPVAGNVRLRFVDTLRKVDIKAPTICEALDADEVAMVRAKLGPDPVLGGPAPKRALDSIHRSRRTLAELLMDQSVIAGVGNVYRAEVLHRLRLDPFIPGREVTPEVFALVWDELVQLMPYGVDSGRILTTDDDLERWRSQLDGPRKPRPTPHYAAYLRTGRPCPRCGHPIAARDLSGRRLYWCPRCQTEGHS